jgi:hypothetical protein
MLTLLLSAGLLAGSTGADIASTSRVLNRPDSRELNPLGARGAMALKSVATVSLLGAEWLLRKHSRARHWFTIVNVGLSIELGGAAIHNSRGIR